MKNRDYLRASLNHRHRSRRCSDNVVVARCLRRLTDQSTKAVYQTDQTEPSEQPAQLRLLPSSASLLSLSLSLCHSLPCFFHQFVHSSCRHFIHPFIHPFNSIPSLFPAKTWPTTWLLQLHSIYQQFSSPAPYLIRNHPEPKNTRSRVQQNILSLPLALMHSFYTQSSWPSLNSTERRNTAIKLCVFELNQFIRR